jgi:predicted DNA-binding transcriptional regulator AlpA
MSAKTTTKPKGEPQPRAPRQMPPPPLPVVTPLDLVGTAEVSALLGVERPRIGRWIHRGVMPQPVAHLAATPVWWREDVMVLKPWVDANRRNRRPKA